MWKQHKTTVSFREKYHVFLSVSKVQIIRFSQPDCIVEPVFITLLLLTSLKSTTLSPLSDRCCSIQETPRHQLPMAALERARSNNLDSHGSHLTPQLDQVCEENNIISICMPSHSSHLLQPLNVGCFAPLKRSYGRLVENQMRLGINHIDKIDFRCLPNCSCGSFSSSYYSK